MSWGAATPATGGFGAAPAAGGWGAKPAAPAAGGWGAKPAAAGGWGAAAPATPTASGGWGGTGAAAGGWGAASGAKLQGAPVQLNLGDLKGQQRYSDLNPQVQQQLLQIEKEFQAQQGCIDDNRKHLSQSLRGDVVVEMRVLDERLDSWLEHLEAMYMGVRVFRSDVSDEHRNAETAIQLVKRLNSHTYSAEEQNHQLPSEYFRMVANRFDARMQDCRRRIEELELILRSGENQRAYSPKMIQEIMDNQHEFFMATTGTIARLHEQIDVMKEEFVAFRKRFDRNYKRNPFDEAKEKRDQRSLRRVADEALKRKTQTMSTLGAGVGVQQPGTAGSGGWGATAAKAPAAGGWGATTAATPAAGGWGASATTTTAATPAAGGWGASATTTTAAAPAAGGWGASATTTAAAPAAGGWGASATTTTAAAPAAGGWGAKTSGFPTLNGGKKKDDF